MGAAIDSPPARELLERYSGIHTCVIGALWRDLPSVRVDNSTGVMELTRHLIEVHRRQRVAFIGARGPEAEERRVGYEKGLRAAGVEVDAELIYPGDFSFAAGRAAAQHWCRNGAPACDAIVAANDWMASGAIDFLQERGYRVPEDVALVGFDDIDRASFMSPPLTTIRQPPRFLGSESVAMIAGMIAGNIGERHVSLPTYTQIRRSCGCFGHASALRTVVPNAAARGSFGDARLRLAASLGRAAANLARGLPDSWAEDLVDALARDIDKETNGFLVHRLTEFVREVRKSLAIDAVMLLETAKLQPVAGKFRGEAADGAAFEAWVERSEGRRVYARGRCHAGPKLVSEAEGVFIHKLGAVTAPSQGHGPP